METSDKSLRCVIVTPERTVLDQHADFVALPLFDGELGVLPSRAPLIGRLGFGELRTTRKGRTENYYVEGGFVQVNADVVSVLTPKAMPVREIDQAAVAGQLSSASGPALDKLRTQLRLAAKASTSPALEALKGEASAVPQLA
jgi:F-type H+-transporting ATPase subunit epsilon